VLPGLIDRAQPTSPAAGRRLRRRNTKDQLLNTIDGPYRAILARAQRAGLRLEHGFTAIRDLEKPKARLYA